MMLEIGGISYLIDLEVFDDQVTTMKSAVSNFEEEVTETINYNAEGDMIAKTVIKTTTPLDKTIDGSKYEMIKYMIDVIMGYGEEIDDALGIQSLNSLPIPFKIAFNTLLYYKILKPLEL